MSAYFIANVRFSDRQKAAEYGQRAAATVGQYGGRYLARGGQVDVVEGDWAVSYLTLIEFPSLADAHRWYESPEYGQTKPLRQDHAYSQLAFVEGMPDA